MSYQTIFPQIKILRNAYKDTKSPIWMKLIKIAQSSYKNKVVNINKIKTYSKDGDFVVCPCKVLGTGLIEHKITLASFGISLAAINKIIKSGGKVVDFEHMINQFPTGKGVIIIG
ncbi:MAG: 50S ribosomal protein L18e [Thaumarchaeota archaeon]|nr:50S ribosomal protein L18e [Nitrososphaerota archaeon]MCY3976213.1 50S ribosomal protein L18e [Nitrososphaerota archaeon]